ncbi:MAG: hypothetical protein MUE60_12695 [Candidatus Eisenbacteria bacterium]|nr:hypothetical protein [Candidatus Eisenbacteria bacterium]
MRIVPEGTRQASLGVPLGVGAFLGWGAVHLIDKVPGMAPAAAQYRVAAVVGKLASLATLPAGVLVAASALGCAGAWVALAWILAAQGRRMGWNATITLALPAALGACVLVASDPLTRGGRLLAVGGAGLASAGQVIVASLFILDPLWVMGGWRPGLRFVWAVSLGLSLASGLWMTLVQEATGDEPSYLLAMHSLVRDHDLDVSNNHAAQDYRFFYPTTITNGQLLPTARGIVLPKHSLGLPVLGAGFYAVGGRMAVSVLCSLIVAALASSIYLLLRKCHQDDAALRCWSAILLCAPLSLYPGQIYPNAAAGLLVVVALLWAPRHAAAAGIALGLIPWFHLGTWSLAVGVLALTVVRHRGARMRLLVTASVLWWALAAMHWHFWGRALPPTDTYGQFQLAMIPTALPGLFLDQEAGLLWIAPIWLAGMHELLPWRNRHPFRSEALLLAAWLVYVSTFSWWYGGWSPTGRFLLPSLGLMAVLLARGLGGCSPPARILWHAGGIITLVLVAQPFFRFNAHDGTHAVLDAAGAFGHALSGLIPSVVTPRPVVWVVWCAVLLLLGCAWRRVDRSA